MVTLFQSGQQVVCIDSKGQFNTSSKWPLIEGKKYTIKNPHHVRKDFKPGFVGVELFMVTGVFDQRRFLPVDVDRKMENEMMLSFKSALK